MIDLHSHLIAGIDDGARSILQSIELARQAVSVGVTHVMCTPHMNPGLFDNNKQSIALAFEQTAQAIRQEGIPLKLSVSAEIRVCPEIIQWVENDEIPYIGMWEGKPAFLLELPHSHIPAGLDNLLNWLANNSIQAIIPHPERNREIISDYSKIHYLRDLGCIFQATAGAFTQRFSEKVHTTVWQMYKDNLLSYIASDMHNIKNRPNDMGAAFSAIAQADCLEAATKLCISIPNSITKQIDWQ